MIKIETYIEEREFLKLKALKTKYKFKSMYSLFQSIIKAHLRIMEAETEDEVQYGEVVAGFVKHYGDELRVRGDRFLRK